MADMTYRFFIATKAQLVEGIRRGVIQDNFLLYIYDSHEIYKGSERFGNDAFVVCASKPEVAWPDKLYCINGELFHYVNNEWVKLSDTHVLDLYDEEQDPTGTVPTTSAVQNAIEVAVASMDSTLTSLTWSKDLGSLTVVRKDGSSEYVKMNGMVQSPEYDSENNVLKLPVVGGDTVEVSFGKDTRIVEGHIAQDNDTLVLGTEDDPEAVLIDISALTSFVSANAVDNTNTVALSINEDGKLVANVKISADEGNILEEREDGLFVGKKGVILF